MMIAIEAEEVEVVAREKRFGKEEVTSDYEETKAAAYILPASAVKLPMSYQPAAKATPLARLAGKLARTKSDT
ncbi:hypothetical protein L2E82_32114 [Cichorium intybus]|uniref:Uncharacterized protein n=1 Tax=Cichorium intybus TaxID=13427 RepID=A0ACB9BGM0_CICIN|nr:hypothetical protein L2E82_32114 [Cichorium intybus]